MSKWDKIAKLYWKHKEREFFDMVNESNKNNKGVSTTPCLTVDDIIKYG